MDALAYFDFTPYGRREPPRWECCLCRSMFEPEFGCDCICHNISEEIDEPEEDEDGFDQEWT